MSKNHDVLIIQLINERFALKTTDIQEIIHFESPTPIPRAAAYIAGVMNFRGSILTILDTAKRIFQNNRNNDQNNQKPGYILITQVDSWPVGLIVNNVEGIVNSGDYDFTNELKTIQFLEEDCRGESTGGDQSCMSKGDLPGITREQHERYRAYEREKHLSRQVQEKGRREKRETYEHHNQGDQPSPTAASLYNGHISFVCRVEISARKSHFRLSPALPWSRKAPMA